MVLNTKDLVFKTKRASGPGGQHVNTTESAVQIQHVPSGENFPLPLCLYSMGTDGLLMLSDYTLCAGTEVCS